MRSRGRTAIVAVALLTLALSHPLAAQRLHRYEARPAAVLLPAAQLAEPSAAGVFLASAVIPGAGQYRLGAGRWVAYVGVEVWAWANWADARGESNDLERAYRDLAWDVARRISLGEREDREFEYYEAMSKYPASGSFDADPSAPGIQPEEDVATFNGDLWKLAREIFVPADGDSVPPTDPELAAAIEYYERNAIGPQHAWAWGDNELEREHFRSLIRQSDEAARASTTLLGVILVNHVVSAVDALITARLRGRAIKPSGLRLRGDARPGPSGPTPLLVIEIATP